MRNAFLMATGLTLSVFAAAPAVAGQADICYSPSLPFTDPNLPTSATPFDCPLAGQDRTINQLATAGWQIVQLSPVVTAGNTTSNQLVIEKP